MKERHVEAGKWKEHSSAAVLQSEGREGVLDLVWFLVFLADEELEGKISQLQHAT